MSHVSYSTYLVQLNKVSNFMPLPYLLHLSREYQRHEHYSIQPDVSCTQLDVSCIQLYVSCIQLHVSSIQLYAHLALEAPASRTCRPEPKRTTRSPAGHVTEYSMVLTGMPHCIMATIH